MVCTMPSPLLGHTRVLFELPASLWADRVSVVGEFNHGEPLALQQARDGAWRVIFDLPTGHQYHFHYLVDGERRTEFQIGSAAIVAAGLLGSLLLLC